MAQILIVDDHEYMRTFLAEFFGQEHVVIVANDGQHALSLITEQFDLIITDLDTPKLSGLTFVQTLRTSPKLKDIKIIAISAFFHNTLNSQTMLAAGATVCLAKPLDIRLLNIVVNRLIKDLPIMDLPYYTEGDCEPCPFLTL